MTYGYARVSSKDQNEDRQLDVYKRQGHELPAICLTNQAYAIRDTDCNYYLTIWFFKRRMPLDGFPA